MLICKTYGFLRRCSRERVSKLRQSSVEGSDLRMTILQMPLCFNDQNTFQSHLCRCCCNLVEFPTVQVVGSFNQAKPCLDSRKLGGRGSLTIYSTRMIYACHTTFALHLSSKYGEG